MLIMLMSIAGAIPVFACFLLILFQHDHSSIRLGLIFLKLGIFFFLIPIQWIRVFLPAPIYQFTEKNLSWASKKNISTITYQHIQFRFSEHIWIWIPRWMFIITILWLLCFFIFLWKQVKKYRMSKRMLLRYSQSSNKYNYSKQYQVCYGSAVHFPYSFGFLHSCIILPECLKNKDDEELILQHEICHVVCHDSLYKLLCLFIICIHFYNPFSYLLLWLYSQLCELRCDYFAIKNISFEKRKEYGTLLINFSAENRLPFSVWNNPFSINNTVLKWRIQNIMKKEKYSISKKIFSAIVALSIIFTSASTIFAYTPPQSTYTYMPIQNGVEITEEFNTITDPITELNFSQSNVLFQAEDGVIEYLDKDTILNSSRILCKTHSYKTGTLSEHQKKPNGGCIVTQYRIKKCTKCNYIASKTRIVQSQYDICPH